MQDEAEHPALSPASGVYFLLDIRGSDMEGTDIKQLLFRIGDELGPKKPSHRVLTQVIVSFDIAAAATVASLILGAWPLLFPRNGPSKCGFKGPFSHRACGQPLRHTEFREAELELVMVCAAGHVTKQRTTRLHISGTSNV